MRNEPQYKTVAITYADDKPLEFILLVTDIIRRTGMKDIKVNVNGGKYDNDRQINTKHNENTIRSPI